MGVYTYDDFTKALQASGGKMTDADMNLARMNPDAGMSILNAITDYKNATTDEARALAHQKAESVRSSYGNYSGGGDGSKFYLEKISPISFNGGEAPTFSYNVETDPVYQAYQKQYAREGRRATQDTLGTVAAATGGIPSSYAVTAAQQAGDYYASQLSDKVPELYRDAYNRHLNDVDQYNKDRAFNYGVWTDEISDQNRERQEAINKEQTDFEHQYALAQLGASVGDFSGYQKLGITPNGVNLYNLAYAQKYGVVPGAQAAAGSGGYSSGGSYSGNSGGGSPVVVNSGSDMMIDYNKIAQQYGGKDLSAAQWEAVKAANNVTDKQLQDKGFNRTPTPADFGYVNGASGLNLYNWEPKYK